MARPLIEINWKSVKKLCALQCTLEEIAWFCACSEDTLERACKRDHQISFSDYYDQQKGQGRISLRRAQWKLAKAGNPTMLIWLGKQHLEQRDKSSHELSGPDGKPIETRGHSRLTDDQLDAKITLMVAKTKTGS